MTAGGRRGARLAAGLVLALLLVAGVRRGGAAGALPVGERRRAPASPRRPRSTGSSATSSRTARGCTSTTPTEDTATRRVQRRSATPARRWVSTRPRRPACRGALAPPTGAPTGRSTGSSSATTGPRSRPRRASPRGATRAARRRAGDPARGHGRHALRRRAAPARALPRRPDRAVGRGARVLRRRARRAGAAASTPSTTRARRTGRWRGCTARSPREALGPVADRIGAYLATDARRRRGQLAADRRPLGRLRPGRHAPSVTPAHRGRAAPTRASRPSCSAARRAGSQQRFGPWGPRGAGRATFRGRRLRRDRRGLHRPVARRAGPIRGWPSCEEPIAARATCMAGLAVRRRPTPRRRRAQGRSAWRARGSSTAGRPAWTTSSTRWPACCARSRSSRLTTCSDLDGDAPGGVAVGARPAAGAQPGPRRVRGPARGGRARGRARLAAVGGAVGGADRRRRAAVGDLLLDAVDVSSAAFRLAAGIVAVLTGAADLLRRPPSPEPALAGRRAALVPVAIPLVARPRSWSWRSRPGADGAAACRHRGDGRRRRVLTALARVATDGPGGRTLRWGSRVLAAGLIVAGAVLGVDGVLGV